MTCLNVSFMLENFRQFLLSPKGHLRVTLTDEFCCGLRTLFGLATFYGVVTFITFISISTTTLVINDDINMNFTLIIEENIDFKLILYDNINSH